MSGRLLGESIPWAYINNCEPCFWLHCEHYTTRAMEQVLLSLMFILLICLCIFFWLKLENIRLKFRRQGIIGPLPSLITGNIPEIKQIMSVVPNSDPANKDPKDISPFYCSLNLFPYFKQWTKQYGMHYKFFVEHNFWLSFSSFASSSFIYLFISNYYFYMWTSFAI